MPKRRREVDTTTSSKKRRSTHNIDLEPWIDINWISATHTRNYMLKDPLLDWLNLHGESKGFVRDSHTNTELQNSLDFTRYIMEKGNEFEKYIVENLKEKHGDNFVTVDNTPEFPVQKKYIRQIKKTYDLMTKGVKIIYQGLVFNPDNKTFGYPDLIVRSDYLNDLVDKKVISSEKSKKGCKFSSSWHYRAVDIKFTTLKLKVDGKNLLNSGSIPPYKAQTYIYNQAIGYMQHLVPRKAYLLGRGWSTSKDEVRDPFDKLAQVDFFGDDIEVKEDVAAALEWIRDVRNEGESWTVFPPSRPELYPNMNNDAYDWSKTKKNIAENLGEITSIWNCGVKNREIAHENGVFEWTNRKCSSKILGVNGKVNAPMVDQILKTNRGGEKYTVDSMALEFSAPKWRNVEGCKFFIDFETVSNINNVKSSEDTGMIFLIGCGRDDEKNNWEFKSFITDSLTLEEEKKIILEFLNYIESICGDSRNCNLYHYSFAETTHFKKALTRHSIVPTIDINWIDLLKVIKDSKFIVKGSLDFSLKSVVKALSEQDMIVYNYDNCFTVGDGCDAMIAGFLANDIAQTQNKSMKEIELIKCVESYNEIDCLTLLQLLNTLSITSLL